MGGGTSRAIGEQDRLAVKRMMAERAERNAAGKEHEPLALKGIKYPHENDVMYGRGRRATRKRIGKGRRRHGSVCAFWLNVLFYPMPDDS